MINYKEIYTFFDPVSNNAYRGSIFDFPKSDATISRGENHVNGIVKVMYSMGGAQPKDVIWTTNGHPLILSEKVVDLFIKNKFTGWDTYQVQVFDKKLIEVPIKYFGLIINGRADYVDYSRSEIITKKIVYSDAPHVKGRYFYNDIWDGSDFFMENPDPDNKINMFRYCTDRVYQVLKKNKITNITFENLIQTDIFYHSLSIGAGQNLKHVLDNLIKKASN